MGRLGGDHAGVRLGLPAGWVEVEPTSAPGPVPGETLQLTTVAAWDEADGVRPTMSLSLAEPDEQHVAARVLAAAHALHDGLHVLSIDPWAARGAPSPGRRLLLAHPRDDSAVTTLAWVAATAGSDVVVVAHVESTCLPRYEAHLVEAVGAIDLSDQVGTGTDERRTDLDAPATADLVGVVPRVPWRPRGPSAPLIVADPDARILVEASVGSTSLTFDATLARDLATVTATASPRAGASHDPASPYDAAEPGTARFHVPAPRLGLAIAEWLGLGPASAPPAAPVTLPIRLVMSRLVDPSVQAPEGADVAAWEQPWFLWTARSSATDSGLVVVDAGTSGQCAVMETPDADTTRFAPLSGYDVWLTLNWLVSQSLGHR